MSIRPRTLAGVIMASLGLVMVLVEIGLHIASTFSNFDYEINHVVLLVAAVIGFIGFYMLDPKGAEDGGGFIVNSATKIIGVIRTGRRTSDVAVVVDDKGGNIPEAPTVPAIPAEPEPQDHK